jgi:5,10-methylenetetrahydrofolate reductase
MMLEEVLGKFISHQMMVKDVKYNDNVTNGSNSTTEQQDVAFKATNNKEALPSKVAQMGAVDLNDEEMTLIIKHFKTALKGHKNYDNKSKVIEGKAQSSVR